MALKQFIEEIKHNSNMMFPLSMSDIFKLKAKHKVNDRNKVDAILKKYGYNQLIWKEYQKRITKDLKLARRKH